MNGDISGVYRIWGVVLLQTAESIKGGDSSVWFVVVGSGEVAHVDL